ncbi:MAG: SAF domain-containing protein [Solirubrobacterales bacterium]
MSRRARAAAFATGALACAVIAASLADGYRNRVSTQYGPLRPVLVAVREIPAGQIFGDKQVRELTEVRRVPARFVPPGALSTGTDALGQAPVATVPIGAYVLAAQLTVPQPPRAQPPSVGQGRRPVQIAVSGAEALSIAGSPEGSLVDVVVSEQPNGSGNSRTYVAAPAVRLLALGNLGPEGNSNATLALTEEQALALIGAEGSAREIRLLPRAGV